MDLHLPKRFFFGWGVRYEVVKPSGGAAPVSHFVSWNVLPLRIGVDLGRTPPFSSTAVKTSASDPATEAMELELRRAQRGRLLLATGVPMLAAGAAGLAVGLKAECHQRDELPHEATAAGATFGAVGLGLSITGIVSLVQASKSARKVPKTELQRQKLIRAATLSTLGSALAISLVSLGSWVSCNFS